MALLEIKNLSKSFGDLQVLKDINIQVEKERSLSSSALRVPAKAPCSDAAICWKSLRADRSYIRERILQALGKKLKIIEKA